MPDVDAMLAQMLDVAEKVQPRAVGLAIKTTVDYYNGLVEEGFDRITAQELTAAYLHSPAFAGKAGTA